MRIGGKEVAAPKVRTLVIPKGDENYVFKAQAVLDYAEFDALCPAPTPPKIIKRGGDTTLDTKDSTYVEAINEYSTRRVDWMFLKSLEATDGLEWETVKMDDPSTWGNYKQELKACFSDVEISKLIELVIDACGLNQDRIEEATQRFLRESQEAQSDVSTQ